MWTTILYPCNLLCINYISIKNKKKARFSFWLWRWPFSLSNISSVLKSWSSQYLGHLMQRTDSLEKSPDAGKDWRREKKGTAKDEMVGWHHRLSRHEFEQAPVDDERWGSQAFFSPWGCKKLDMTEWLNNNKKCKEEIANHCPRAINHSKHSDISLSHFPCVYWVFRCALVNACMYTCVQVCDLDESSFAIFCSVSVLHFHCEPLPISLNSNFCCLVVRSCLNLWDPMDSILPGSKDTGVGCHSLL